MDVNNNSKKRIEEALSYSDSNDRKLYTDQRIPNNRVDILNALEEGIKLSSKSGRYKIVSSILMKNE